MNSFFKKLTGPVQYLFWKTQIDILRAIPPLQYVAYQYGMSASRSRKLWIQTLFHVALRTPQAIFRHLCDIKEKRTVLPDLMIGLTSRCTLNCDKCFARVPEVRNLQNMGDIPLSVLKDDLRNLFSCVDHIYNLVFSGGEAFMHPDLHEIIRICADSGKTANIAVLTNGTIIPDEKLLKALKEANVTVKISKYPKELQPRVEELKAVLQTNEIPFYHLMGGYWYDVSSPGQLQPGSAKRRFQLCASKMCLSYFKGKLHLCATSILVEGGIIPDFKEDYIDLRTIAPAEFHEQWEKLRHRRVINACAYCLGSSYETPHIPVAVQRTSGNNP